VTDPTTLPELLDVAKVAEYLHVSPKTVEREVYRGRLPFTRVGRALRFTREHVRQYLEQQQGAPCPGKGPANSANTGSARTGTGRGAARGSIRGAGKLAARLSAQQILRRQ
jgi:excisionase family DNA binding protein